MGNNGVSFVNDQTVFTALSSVRSRSSTYVKYDHKRTLAKTCTRYETTLERNELRGMIKVYQIHGKREQCVARYTIQEIQTARAE